MSNSFYNKTNAPSPNSPGSSAQIRNEFDLVYQAFNKMPVLSLANANKLVAINSTGNGLTQVNSLTGIGGIDNTPIGATTPSTGSFTNLLASGVVNLGLAVAIGGGTINNSIIGGVTPNAAYFTTAAASSGFTGNLTGNVTGNLTGNVVGNVTGNIASSGTSTFNNLTITGTLDMSSGTAGTITGLSTPSNASDAATKQYVDTADALKLNLAGGTMSGEIAMGGNRITGMANPSSAQDAATKTYVDTADALKLNLSGGALTGALAMSGNKITGLGTPTASTDAANKAYVDNAIQGLDAKASVRVASTANLNLTGTQTVDGVALVVGDRVLVKNQDTPAANGLYTVSSGTWTRTTDGDTWDELVAAYVFVEDGTTNGRNGFLCTITQGGTIGVTSISWVQFNSAGQIDAGNGLTKTGNRLDVATASADRIVVNPDNIDLAVTGISAGTYKSVTVDIYGRVVSGGNPNSLSGYGITDAYSKTEADLLYDAKLSRSGGTMTGAIAMGNNKITGLGTPTTNGDAVTKLYADGKLALTGGTMSGAIAMGSNKITGLADPTVAQDAVTLNYVTTLYGTTASAATSAANAATSEANALNYKNAAGVSASNAADSAAAAAASYDAFDDRYLGSKTSDPTTDNDGNPLLDGAMYWNSTLAQMKVYNLALTNWSAAYVPSGNYLLKTGDTMTGALTLSGSPTANLHAATKQYVDTFTYGGSLTSGQVTSALGFTPENAARKGTANGYAALGSDGKVPAAQLPAIVNAASDITNTPSGNISATNVQAALNELDSEKSPTTHNHDSVYLKIAAINHIGTPGALGFGVGISPTLPAGFVEMAGCRDSSSDNYGNYMHLSGSIMVWVPAFYYKWGTGSNGLSVNVVDIKPFSAYADVATANAAGYALHRAFYDGGVQPGFFIDKFLCSNSNGIFTAVKNGIPCDTDGSQSGIAALTGVGTNNYGFIQKAASQRGANFHSASIFMHKALAMLSYAHAQSSSNTTYCAWYNATYNFPKGCNNNALGDTNDGALSFVTAGHTTYPNKPKAGSANVFAKTTHNGQNSGVCDLNGSMWEVAFGLTSDGTNYYVLKTSKRMRDLIGSDATSSNSFFGASGISTNYDNLGSTYGAVTASNTAKNYGSTNQVFDAAVSGNAWAATGAALPLSGGVGGTNAFGSDGLWDYRPNEMCPLVSAAWHHGSNAGVWALNLATVRSDANTYVGGRAALYL